MKVRRLSLSFALLGAVLTGSFSAFQAVNDGDSGPPVVAPATEQAGRAFVRLLVATSPESALDAAGIAAQRRAIATASEALAQRLPGTEVELVHRYRTLPFVSLRGTPSALDALVASGQVGGWRPVERFQPSLFKSLWTVQALPAWNRGWTGEGKAVAIVDTGVDVDHPFLGGRVIAEACFASGWRDLQDDLPPGWELNPDAVDDDWFTCPDGSLQQVGPGAAPPCEYLWTCEHGTHTAGVAAGLGASGILGIAPLANIVAVQAAEPVVIASGFYTSIGPNLTEDNVTSALEWLYLEHESLDLAAVNLSFGRDTHNLPFAPLTLSSSPCPDTGALATAVQNLKGVGVAVVAAAGNNGLEGQAQYPACLPDVVSVGASTLDDTVANFTNSADWVDLLAPGMGYPAATPTVPEPDGYTDSCNADEDHHWGICSSIPGGTGTGNGAQHSGTSVAAAHVTAAFAILKQKYPDASVEALLGHLRYTGTSLPVPGTTYSIPRINLDLATSCELGFMCFLPLPSLPMHP
ncbi:MAG: S8 family serine peptidase [Proteobacteria bacterium]|nr:S8 family serine peptidase [Pseudomonadota bacterium]